MLDEAKLRAALGSRPFRYYPSVGSTNDLAAAWLKAGAPTGAVVIADEQLSGRGRHGRVWRTPPNSALAVSIVLRPDANRAFLANMIGALAVAEMCAALGVQVGIKWPNDVQVHGRKLAGILPEAIWQEQSLLGVVLGVGVNVRVPFADDLAQQAINLEEAVGHPLDRPALIADVLRAVDGYSQSSAAVVLERWRSRLVTLGQRVRVGEVEGVAEDTDETGALLIRTEAGRIERVLAGDVALAGG